MRAPALNDTIVAVSTAWEAAPLGIIRLSGADAFELVAALAASAPQVNKDGPPRFTRESLSVQDGLTLPAMVYWFPAQRSYTGQPVVEIHTVGSLPALRAGCARLIDGGARRALPGEFTSRAYLNGRMDFDAVEGVLTLIETADGAAARSAARLVAGEPRARLEEVNETLTELIALIEAGIDFVEEEDIRFVSPAEACERIAEVLNLIEQSECVTDRRSRRAKPHVALAGLPNAGKSTLFNALLGFERAIVSPVIGTTRDVLSADVTLDGVQIVLQDCAGLGASTGELELAAHVLAERAAERADLVLWVHDRSQHWSDEETRACREIGLERSMLVLSKSDLATDAAESPSLRFERRVQVSAADASGLDALRHAMLRHLESAQSGTTGPVLDDLPEVRAPLRRALALAEKSTRADFFSEPELVALELRTAWERIKSVERGPLVEETLSRIFTSFCVGK